MADAMTPDPREDKLPRWAQDTLRQLRRTVEDRDTHIGKLRGEGPQDSRVIVDPYVNEVPLHESDTIRFHFPNNEYIDVHLREGVLDIRASDLLALRPRSGNAATAEVSR